MPRTSRIAVVLFVILAVSAGRTVGFQSEPSGDEVLAKAFRERLSNTQVEGGGVVSKLLEDDTNGKRHQRFILRLRSGQTLLIAHNIEIAPRVQSLQVKDDIRFSGEYEWNSKGGVIHWTHRDPARKHKDGWLKHKGKLYQ